MRSATDDLGDDDGGLGLEQVGDHLLGPGPRLQHVVEEVDPGCPFEGVRRRVRRGAQALSRERSAT
jgi:hypothetical protein